MTTKQLIRKAHKFAEPFRVSNGRKFRLKDFDPRDTLWLTSEDKPRAKEALALGIEALATMQDMLYAQDRWAVLLIFQAMDAAGKDGAIKHVMSGVNPQGCEVTPFKAPSAEELDHDYLWRCMRVLPNRGHIGIFNRSTRTSSRFRKSARGCTRRYAAAATLAEAEEFLTLRVSVRRNSY